MTTERIMSPAEIRVGRINAIMQRDGVLCFHPDCRLPFKNLHKDIEVTLETLNQYEDVTFDHWLPRSAGGTWDIENLRLMHKRCNAVKSDDLPNADGTLPPKKRALNSNERRKLRQSVRIEVCQVCNAGRNLGPDEFCETCGSVPMPFTHPQWSKMKPQDCEHAGIWWCWACMSGIIEREPAIISVLDGEGSLDGQ